MDRSVTPRALGKPNGPCADPAHFLFAVRDVNEGEAEICLEPKNLPAKFVPKFVVKTGKRFIHEHCKRSGDQRPSNRNTLLLATQKSRRVGPAREPPVGIVPAFR
jgi:hypothetical protein